MAVAAGLKPSTVLVKEIKKANLNTRTQTSRQINITCNSCNDRLYGTGIGGERRRERKHKRPL